MFFFISGVVRDLFYSNSAIPFHCITTEITLSVKGEFVTIAQRNVLSCKYNLTVVQLTVNAT